MRRLFLIAVAVLFSLAALLPAQRSFVASAVSDGERRAMFSKPSVVRIIDGVAGTHSEVNRLSQDSQQKISEGKDESGLPTSWIIGGVLALLFIIVAVIVIAVVVFLLMRRRSKAQSKSHSGTDMSAASMTAARGSGQRPDAPRPAPPPSYSPSPAQNKPSSPPIPPHHAMGADRSATDDLSRTMAIVPEADTNPMNYGSIKFVTGLLAGQKFDITPDGAAIGRDATLSQIVITDPRISKRHLWIGVKDGRVIIADQNSRNGTFLNDPKSRRVTETSLHHGDTVILGESDVARFEYQK